MIGQIEQRRFADRLGGVEAFLALGGDGEVDHHDAVLLDDADEQNGADERDQTELVAEQHERRQRAQASRGQRRQDGQRVNEALVEDAENQIDADKRRENQERHAGQRILERLRVALEGRRQARGQLQRLHRALDRLRRLPSATP